MVVISWLQEKRSCRRSAKHIHPVGGIFFIVALTAGVSGSVMGVMGIIADINFEWSKTIIDGDIAPIYIAIFAIGIIAASVSSQFPNVLMLPWLLCDYNQSEREMTLPMYRIMVFLFSLLGLVVPTFEARPVFVLIVSQAFQSIILPVTVGCILYLGNRRDLMGEHKHTPLTNVFLITILLFSIVTTSMGVKGVWQLITS